LPPTPPVLQEGKVTRFLGFDVVYSERLTSTSNLRQNIVWVRSGIYLGVWQDLKPDFSPDFCAGLNVLVWWL
jgi:hypothetical protein